MQSKHLFLVNMNILPNKISLGEFWKLKLKSPIIMTMGAADFLSFPTGMACSNVHPGGYTFPDTVVMCVWCTPCMVQALCHVHMCMLVLKWKHPLWL